MGQNIDTTALTALLNQSARDSSDATINVYELSKFYFVDTDEENNVMKLYIIPGKTVTIPAHVDADGGSVDATDYDYSTTGDGILICNFAPGQVDSYYRLVNNRARLAGVTTGQGNRGSQYHRLVIGNLSYGYLGEFDSVYDLNRHGLFVLHDPKYITTDANATADTGAIAIIKFNNIATIKIGAGDGDARGLILRLVDNEIIDLDTREKRRSFMSQFNIWKLTQSHA